MSSIDSLALFNELPPINSMFKPREMDETWEMNIHINPIDEESEKILHKHMAILSNNRDDFVTYVKHVESK
jgi:hypothetical protein